MNFISKLSIIPAILLVTSSFASSDIRDVSSEISKLRTDVLDLNTKLDRVLGHMSSSSAMQNIGTVCSGIAAVSGSTSATLDLLRLFGVIGGTADGTPEDNPPNTDMISKEIAVQNLTAITTDSFTDNEYSITITNDGTPTDMTYTVITSAPTSDTSGTKISFTFPELRNIPPSDIEKATWSALLHAIAVEAGLLEPTPDPAAE